MEIQVLHQLFLKSSGICTDTRKIKSHCMFFALKGENFDANAFADDAVQKGADFVIIDNPIYCKANSNNYILVKDTLKTLQELAKFHRQYLNIPILALTGSNGKTTTKELINIVLSKNFKTVATTGNLNNHIGVPLTLLSMDNSTEIGIVEMGANHPGEIALLSNIALPNYGYITNFGKAHLEGFGSIEGVMKAKSELYENLKITDGIAFVNANDAKQMSVTAHQKRVFTENLVIIETNNSEFLTVQYQDTVIKTHLVGNYNLSNVAAALSIGIYFDIPITAIKTAIESFEPDNKRSQFIDKQYCKIILDAYNANPTSMEAAILNFTKSNASQKIMILGDMFELGSESEVEHQRIAEIAENNCKKVILIGERFYNTPTLFAQKYKNIEDFKTIFDTQTFIDHTILIKGSRGMAMERVLDWF